MVIWRWWAGRGSGRRWTSAVALTIAVKNGWDLPFLQITRKCLSSLRHLLESWATRRQRRALAYLSVSQAAASIYSTSIQSLPWRIHYINHIGFRARYFFFVFHRRTSTLSIQQQEINNFLGVVAEKSVVALAWLITDYEWKLTPDWEALVSISLDP